jgi:hypothetical protein
MLAFPFSAAADARVQLATREAPASSVVGAAQNAGERRASRSRATASSREQAWRAATGAWPRLSASGTAERRARLAGPRAEQSRAGPSARGPSCHPGSARPRSLSRAPGNSGDTGNNEEPSATLAATHAAIGRRGQSRERRGPIARHEPPGTDAGPKRVGAAWPGPLTQPPLWRASGVVDNVVALSVRAHALYVQAIVDDALLAVEPSRLPSGTTEGRSPLCGIGLGRDPRSSRRNRPTQCAAVAPTRCQIRIPTADVAYASPRFCPPRCEPCSRRRARLGRMPGRLLRRPNGSTGRTPRAEQRDGLRRRRSIGVRRRVRGREDSGARRWLVWSSIRLCWSQ